MHCDNCTRWNEHTLRQEEISREDLAMFGNLGAGEILLILVFILIFFGPKKIPEIAQGLGKGIREFRKATREIQEVVEKEVNQVKEVGQIKEVNQVKDIAQALNKTSKS
jgi:sec-independent protein translocase protein TatA